MTTISRWLLSGLLCLYAQAQAQVLRAALPHIEPHSYVDALGQAQGVYVDLLRELSQRSGLAIQVEIVPFARANHALALREADLSFGIETEGHRDSVVQIAQLGQLDLVVWPLQGQGLAQAAELKGLPVGRLRGGCLPLSSHAPQFVELVDFDQGLRMARLQRVAALCGSRDVIAYAIKRSAPPWPALSAPLLLLQRSPLFLLGRKGLPAAVQDALAQHLTALRTDGRYQSIREAYGLN